ncbi:MAG: FAD-dependent oxidoreductase, partial [Bacillota bacterium]
MKEKTDILIVGGGVTGCFIARELSRFDVDVTLVEKEP